VGQEIEKAMHEQEESRDRETDEDAILRSGSGQSERSALPWRRVTSALQE
jgi:hypothetical protein